MPAITKWLALLAAFPAPLTAHPMPHTEVTVTRGATALALTIRLPLSDLLLALPPGSRRDPAALRGYFARHTRLLGPRGESIPVAIGPIRRHREHGHHVGAYQELEVTAAALITRSAPVSLAYDGILHRIANHRAIVRDPTGRPLGTIRYDLTTKRAAPLRLPSL